MKVGSAVNFRLQTMAALDEFALKQSNPCCIVLGSVGASQPQHLDTCNTFPAAPPKGAPKQHRSDCQYISSRTAKRGTKRARVRHAISSRTAKRGTLTSRSLVNEKGAYWLDFKTRLQGKCDTPALVFCRPSWMAIQTLPAQPRLCELRRICMPGRRQSGDAHARNRIWWEGRAGAPCAHFAQGGGGAYPTPTPNVLPISGWALKPPFPGPWLAEGHATTATTAIRRQPA